MPDLLPLAHCGVVVCFVKIGALDRPRTEPDQRSCSEQGKPRENRVGVGIAQIALAEQRIVGCSTEIR